MTGMSANHDPAEAPALSITRLLPAPRALVFQAWGEPEHLARWWAPFGFTTLSVEADFTVGGAWRACIRSPEGEDYRMHGVYREIAAPERLVFSHAWEDATGADGDGTLVTVTFAPSGEGTEVVFHQAGFASTEDRDSQGEGWAECLDILALYLAKLKASGGVAP